MPPCERNVRFSQVIRIVRLTCYNDNFRPINPFISYLPTSLLGANVNDRREVTKTEMIKSVTMAIST